MSKVAKSGDWQWDESTKVYSRKLPSGKLVTRSKDQHEASLKQAKVVKKVAATDSSKLKKGTVKASKVSKDDKQKLENARLNKLIKTALAKQLPTKQQVADQIDGAASSSLAVTSAQMKFQQPQPQPPVHSVPAPVMREQISTPVFGSGVIQDSRHYSLRDDLAHSSAHTALVGDDLQENDVRAAELAIQDHLATTFFTEMFTETDLEHISVAPDLNCVVIELCDVKPNDGDFLLVPPPPERAVKRDADGNIIRSVLFDPEHENVVIPDHETTTEIRFEDCFGIDTQFSVGVPWIASISMEVINEPKFKMVPINPGSVVHEDPFLLSQIEASGSWSVFIMNEKPDLTTMDAVSPLVGNVDPVPNPPWPPNSSRLSIADCIDGVESTPFSEPYFNSGEFDERANIQPDNDDYILLQANVEETITQGVKQMQNGNGDLMFAVDTEIHDKDGENYQEETTVVLREDSREFGAFCPSGCLYVWEHYAMQCLNSDPALFPEQLDDFIALVRVTESAKIRLTIYYYITTWDRNYFYNNPHWNNGWDLRPDLTTVSVEVHEEVPAYVEPEFDPLALGRKLTTHELQHRSRHLRKVHQVPVGKKQGNQFSISKDASDPWKVLNDHGLKNFQHNMNQHKKKAREQRHMAIGCARSPLMIKGALHNIRDHNRKGYRVVGDDFLSGLFNTITSAATALIPLIPMFLKDGRVRHFTDSSQLQYLPNAWKGESYTPSGEHIQHKYATGIFDETLSAEENMAKRSEIGDSSVTLFDGPGVDRANPLTDLAWNFLGVINRLRLAPESETNAALYGPVGDDAIVVDQACIQPMGFFDTKNQAFSATLMMGYNGMGSYNSDQPYPPALPTVAEMQSTDLSTLSCQPILVVPQITAATCGSKTGSTAASILGGSMSTMLKDLSNTYDAGFYNTVTKVYDGVYQNGDQTLTLPWEYYNNVQGNPPNLKANVLRMNVNYQKDGLITNARQYDGNGVFNKSLNAYFRIANNLGDTTGNNISPAIMTF